MPREIESAEELAAMRALTEKETAFVEHYTALGLPTCGNARRSAQMAGYGEDDRSAPWRLVKRPAVRAAIRAVHADRMHRLDMTAGKVLHDLEHERMLALDKGDIAAAIRASELQGKTLAMFRDRLAFETETPEREEEYSQAEIDAKRVLAAVLLERSLSKPVENDAAAPALLENQPQPRPCDGKCGKHNTGV